MDTTEHNSLKDRLTQAAVDPVRLMHELHTHQVKLEMQNEELRRVEHRLRQTSKRFTDLYDFAPIGYFTMTRRGVIRGVNLKGSSFLNRDRIHLIGTLFTDYLSPQSFDTFTEHLRELAESNQERECEVEVPQSNGQIFYAHVSSMPWFDEEFGATSIRTVVMDVTRRKTLETEMIEARRKAELASQAKSQFLANMSHEIRTPLGVILGFSEVLLEEVEENKNLTEPVLAIRRNGEHLLNIINEILDLAKVESGRLEVEMLLISLEAAVTETLNLLAMKAKAKGISLSYEILGDCPDLISSDPTRFRQILLNLVGNAIKFTDEGSIKLSLSRIQGEREQSLACIDVADTGCGIREESRCELFKPFSQADVSTTRKYGGTGLGLVLSQHLAQALGGDVLLLSSELGKGSVFRLTINPGLGSAPRRIGPPKTETVMLPEFEVKPTLHQMRIMVISGFLNKTRELARLLEENGAVVHAAEEGFDGASKVLSHSFDMLLLDTQAPGLSSVEMIRVLRNNGFDRPILALMSQTDAHERMRALEMGFNGVLARPFSYSQVLREILRHIKRHN